MRSIVINSDESDDISEITSNPGHRTDSEQGNELETNISSGSVYVPNLLTVLCTVKVHSFYIEES